MTPKTRIAMIGCGIMAGWHIREIIKYAPSSEIVATCEPSEAAYNANARLFSDAGMEPPPNQPDLARLLAEHAVDTAFIITPHVHHHDQTVACMEAGLDVLLEKPMVMSTAEAESLIAAQERTGRLLVVAFPGGLSPRIRKAVAMLRSGELGRLLSISATVWQDWGALTSGTWRQVPQLAGGGFLFDTGAHMLNTVCDLAGQELAEIAAWLEDSGRPVETMGVVMGRLESGVMVTMHACGETIPSCASDVRVFCTGAILRTGVWGERLDLQRAGAKQLRPVKVPASTGVWQQFLAVRRGEIANPCPPEVGLRMARLYDAIKASAAQGGQPVQLNQSTRPS